MRSRSGGGRQAPLTSVDPAQRKASFDKYHGGLQKRNQRFGPVTRRDAKPDEPMGGGLWNKYHARLEMGHGQVVDHMWPGDAKPREQMGGGLWNPKQTEHSQRFGQGLSGQMNQQAAENQSKLGGGQAGGMTNILAMLGMG